VEELNSKLEAVSATVEATESTIDLVG